MTVEEKGRAEWFTEASLLLAVLLLGTNPVAVKVAVSEVPALPFVAMRFTLAGLLLLVVVLLLGLHYALRGASCGSSRTPRLRVRRVGPG
jgi:drug/metabolite transporter (DMT)-like permease